MMKNVEYPYYFTPDIANMQEIVRWCAETYGEKTAFYYLKKNVEIKKSYATFFKDVVSLCNYFVINGYNRTHIALLGENSYEWLVSYFAIVNSNNVVVPLDKELSTIEISAMLKKSDSAVLMYSDDYEEEAKANENVKLINLELLADIVNENKTASAIDMNFFKSIPIDNDAMCTIVYTSGTTAEPKGVMLSHKNIVADTIATSKSVRVEKSSLLALPLQHTYGLVAGVTIPMIVGSSIFINSSTRNLIRDIKYSKPEYIAVVPLIAEVLLKKVWQSAKNSRKEKSLKRLVKMSDVLYKIGIDFRRKLFSSVIEEMGGNLKMIVIGGAPVDPECVKVFNSFGIKALVGYGITECSPVVSTVRNEHYCPESVGTVHPGIFVRVVDREIQVKGDTVFLGYYKDLVATEDAFDEGWFKTGDIGEIKAGFLYIAGRKKNLIVLSNGKNISPEEIEYSLKSEIPDIKEIVVYSNNEDIIAEIYADEDKKESIRDNLFEFNKKQPLYKQIKNIYFRSEEFEKTTTKKIRRNNVGGNKNA